MTARPTVEQVWAWLAEVPDPEIPVVSVVDLGIVRDVEWQGDDLVVTVTPTYSGCPATGVIRRDIDRRLRERGIANPRLVRRLSPPWTTAWISPGARARLEAWGIAPPVEGPGSVDPVVPCPRCGSRSTERVSLFGSTPCKAAYRCVDCLEPFDYFKCL